MNVRFKKTDKGEVAILPRKDYEALAAKAAEADEDIGTARLVARARREIATGAPLIPKAVVDRIAKGESIKAGDEIEGLGKIEPEGNTIIVNQLLEINKGSIDELVGMGL